MSGKKKLVSDPPLRQILPPERIDDVAEALIALTREVWVLTDRMLVMEKIMAQNGTNLTAQIDAFQPDKAFEKVLRVRRRRLLNKVLTALRAEVGD